MSSKTKSYDSSDVFLPFFPTDIQRQLEDYNSEYWFSFLAVLQVLRQTVRIYFHYCVFAGGSLRQGEFLGIVTLPDSSLVELLVSLQG